MKSFRLLLGVIVSVEVPQDDININPSIKKWAKELQYIELYTNDIGWEFQSMFTEFKSGILYVLKPVDDPIWNNIDSPFENEKGCYELKASFGPVDFENIKLFDITQNYKKE